jgi:hypothetical protein
MCSQGGLVRIEQENENPESCFRKYVGQGR